MQKNLFSILFFGLLFISASCVTAKKAKPKTLKRPDMTGFNYYVIDSGMTVSLQFKNKLELDSIQIDFAVVTSNESGEGKIISEKVKTSGTKLEVRIDRTYFTDQVFYDSMMDGQFQYPVKLFRISAKPVTGEIVLEKGKDKINNSVYFDQRVEKQPDGFHFSGTFDDPKLKGYKLKYFK